MNDDAARTRFSATIGRGGTISVPAEVMSRFRQGQAVQVTLAPGRRDGARRGVEIDEDEVTWIAALQAEPAALIRRCLEAQGAMPPARPRRKRTPGRRSGRTAVRGEGRR